VLACLVPQEDVAVTGGVIVDIGNTLQFQQGVDPLEVVVGDRRPALDAELDPVEFVRFDDAGHQ
jgi:hypothetical protein